MADSKPTFVFFPGAFSLAEVYDPVGLHLRKHGYPTKAFCFPSVLTTTDEDRVFPIQCVEGDVVFVREHVKALVSDELKDVIVVCHSYGGVPVTDAITKDLGKKDRQVRGLEGGVRRIVYIRSVAIAEGDHKELQMPTWITHEKEAGIIRLTPDAAREMFLNDLPQHDADFWTTKLRYHDPRIWGARKQVNAAWRYIPSTYIIAQEDQCFPPAFARQMVAQEAPNAFDTVETCEGAGHFVMLSRSEWLAAAFIRAAESV